MKASTAQKSTSTNNDNKKVLLISRGLPDDVVLCILARLPWAVQARFRCVCRTWNSILLQSRRPFPFVVGGAQLALLDPLTLRCKSLPAIAATLYPTDPWPLAACATSGYVAFGCFAPRGGRSTLALLNLQTMQWHELPWPYREEGLLYKKFSAVIAGGYVYIIKGSKQGTSSHQVRRLKLQDDMASRMWECIPDMHEERHHPVVLVLDGCVWALGGATADGGQCVYSGEVWDPSLETWTLIPELWPSHLFEGPPQNPGPETVVAVQGKIYAISSRTGAIVYYEHAVRAWRNLCLLAPLLPSAPLSVYVCNLFAVGNELWLVCGTHFLCGVITTMLPRTATASHIPLWATLPLQYTDPHWREDLQFGCSFKCSNVVVYM